MQRWPVSPARPYIPVGRFLTSQSRRSRKWIATGPSGAGSFPPTIDIRTSDPEFEIRGATEIIRPYLPRVTDGREEVQL